MVEQDGKEVDKVQIDERGGVLSLAYLKNLLGRLKVSGSDISTLLRLTVRPFSGFWDLKYEQKGKLNIAFYLIAILVFVLLLQKQFTGFIVNYYDPQEFNSFEELIYVLVPFFTFCIANWALTTLMDGEGKFVEIIISLAYSLTPLIIMTTIAMLVSNFLTVDETEYYYSLLSIGTLWFLFLLFVGNMTVHQFSVGKTVATLALTLVAMFLLFFLALLFFSLIQQMIAFGSTIYQELIFRT